MGSKATIKKGNLNNFNNRLQSCSRHLKAFTFRFSSSSSIIVIVSNNNKSNLYMKRTNEMKITQKTKKIRRLDLSLSLSESNLSS